MATSRPVQSHEQRPSPDDVPSCDAALARAFQFLGKRWSGMVLGTLMTAPASFSDIRRALGGVSDSVLSERLTELAQAGLVLREVEAGPPVAVRYRLTPAGQALLPALQELMGWSRTHLPADGCP
jgi:DNA-binding HxlR family transcriptional regulator